MSHERRRDEITALIHEYAFRLDAGDLDGVAALFENAELRSTRHDRVLRGAAEARTLYDRVIIYDDGTPRTMHQLTNVTVRSTATRTTAPHATSRCSQVTGQGLHPILARRVPRPVRARRRRWRVHGAHLRPATVRRPVADMPARGGSAGVSMTAVTNRRRSSCSAHRATSRPGCCSRRCSRSSTASGSRT